MPIHWVLCYLITSTSKGDAIFAQSRIGRDEKPFFMYKYRSMRQDCDDAIHRQFLEQLNANADQDAFGEDDAPLKMVEDPRITKIGHFIRKTSLDEIPQFFNVFKGDMSLVGPRPCLDYEMQAMEGWEHNRFLCKQGVTGFWQVYGRSRCSLKQSHFLDCLSAFVCSPSYHLMLIIKTPIVMLQQKGAF